MSRIESEERGWIEYTINTDHSVTIHGGAIKLPDGSLLDGFSGTINAGYTLAVNNSDGGVVLLFNFDDERIETVKDVIA